MHACMQAPCPTGTSPTTYGRGLAIHGSQPHDETSRCGARRLSRRRPRTERPGPFWMLLARDLFNRFLLHARHVLRAVASGQEARATSGRAAIGRRGSAWPTHAARPASGRGPTRGARREEEPRADGLLGAGWLAAATTTRRLHACDGAT